jgi:single-stranded-DNA-specific exonuclease
MLWQQLPIDAAHRDRLAQACGIHPRLAEVLLQRGISTPADVGAFLSPLLSQLTDPFAITHLQAAAQRLVRAMAERERILVFGDYDVDGVTSTTLLVSILKRFGLSPYPLVPRRLEEGYGLSLPAIDRALKEYHPQLFIAVDCGTNSVAEVAYLRAQGIDVIIIDHHTGKAELPDALLINPHVNDPADAPWRTLCTVGLVFKLAHGLLKHLRQSGDAIAQEIDIKDYLDLVALGTVADMVPLRGENRILARAGLDRLKSTRRLGISALFEVSGLRLGDTIKPFDISFRLGPRINASGRLADASLPIQMLLSHDAAFCKSCADQLDSYNRERQEIEKSIYEAALTQIDPSQPAHVLYDASWHPGVVGVVASRLTHDLHRPCIVLGGEADRAKGSGRSIEGVNLVEMLTPSRDYLISWGGHPMAVGVSLKPEHLPSFRSAFQAAVGAKLSGRSPDRVLGITASIPSSEITPTLLEALDQLGPYGIENPTPTLATYGVRLNAPVDIFNEKHYRFQLQLDDGRAVWGVAWGKAKNPPPHDRPIDIAYELSWNLWKGRKYLQLTLLDWRLSTGA